ncbi:MAG TPA: hypothetical protein VEH49_04090, partial [Methylomirabilota bacterium]|nr:hypothetical protein [Methylomirabilota bacterium]
MLTHEIRMSFEVSSQSCGVARVQQFYRSPESDVLDSLVMRQIQLVGERWFFNVPLQLGVKNLGVR